jgi:excisionase family DNA binding protein
MSLGFVSPSEVATLLGLSTRAVYNEIQAGTLRAYQFRGRYRIKAADLDAYITKARVA